MYDGPWHEYSRGGAIIGKATKQKDEGRESIPGPIRSRKKIALRKDSQTAKVPHKKAAILIEQRLFQRVFLLSLVEAIFRMGLRKSATNIQKTL